MKTKLTLYRRGLGCLLLMALTHIATPNAQSEPSLRGTVRVIKQRVTNTVNKVKNAVDDDRPSSKRTKQPQQQMAAAIPNENLSIQKMILPLPLPPSAPDPSEQQRAVVNGPGVTLISKQPGNRAADSLQGREPQPGDVLGKTAPANAQAQAGVNPSAAAPAPVAPQPPEEELKYATPVAGHPGFIYIPGAKEDKKNMLDVRGLRPGQKVRDPASGKKFLVP